MRTWRTHYATWKGQPEEMYGRRKMTRYLRRNGHQVAFCTADRIMRVWFFPAE